MQQTIKNIKRWAVDKGLDKSETNAQMVKLMEEVGELAAAIGKDREKEDILDALGDCVVVLTILGMQTGCDIEESTALAYGEIKDRKGRMINGVFVKQEDLGVEYAEYERLMGQDD